VVEKQECAKMINQIEMDINVADRLSEENKRRLVFSGVKNFRDLGGYRALDGRTVVWGRLYRSDQLQKLTDADLKHMEALTLDRIIDFRADHEREDAPDRIPSNSDIQIIEIPILDSSTQIWRDSRDQFVKDNLRNIDPVKFMVETNVELATRFTPQMRQFIHELFSAKGRPVLFHCAAGKDRTGYAAAILLRILGVPLDVVMEDYLLSNQYYLAAHSRNLLMLRLMKGKRFSDTVKGFLEVRPAYLAAAFEAIDREFGSFERYTRSGLGLTEQDVEHLKNIYLASNGK
jgi:protein-tyrosine phosphatase